MGNTSKTYFAVGLNDSLEGGRVAGTLEVSGSRVKFIYHGTEVDLPTNGIQVKMGGSGNNLVFFSHSMVPEWSVYTSDKSILHDPVILQNQAFSSLQTERKKGIYLTIAWVLGFSLILTLVLYGLYFIRASFSYAVASQIPIKWEKELGDSVFKSLVSGKKLFQDESTLALLEPVTDPLINAAKDSGYEFKVHIVEDSSLNAFALPGGNIVIHTGLILEAETPEEIAGVLAHEISHVTEKHGLRQIINTIGVFVLVQTLFGDFTGLLAVLTQNSGLLIRSKFSRDFEREADAKGFQYLLHSKVDPSGMVKFFERIQKIEKDSSIDPDMLTFISTHPGTEERIVTMKEKIELISNKDFIPISMKLKKLKAVLKKD